MAFDRDRNPGKVQRKNFPTFHHEYFDKFSDAGLGRIDEKHQEDFEAR
jgi:hypothetical protein